MKALVVGLGMGQQYKQWLAEMGYEVTTVDPDPEKHADHLDLDTALLQQTYDLAYVGTPNWIHEYIARRVALQTRLLLVEKPGVKSKQSWKNIVDDYTNTRIMMVKNNQYRAEIKTFKSLADISKMVHVRWTNKNRIPNPGGWFTTKEKAFGGVSRDLIPHMLSYYCVLTNYCQGSKLYSQAQQRHKLKDITSTDYGVVNQNGLHDVDDFCEFKFDNNGVIWILTADWKNDTEDDSSITFYLPKNDMRFELGLCPMEAYQTMIKTAEENMNNDDFWHAQLDQDSWIHSQIEDL